VNLSTSKVTITVQILYHKYESQNTTEYRLTLSGVSGWVKIKQCRFNVICGNMNMAPKLWVHIKILWHLTDFCGMNNI
jgi:hypothetical protein